MNTASSKISVLQIQVMQPGKHTMTQESEHEKQLTDMIPFKKVLENRIPLQ